MELENFKYKLKGWFDYTVEYIHKVFFKLLIFFILNFILFGLYFKEFFKANFIIFLVFLIIDLYLIKKLLYKRTRATKILIILIVLILSFYAAKAYSNIAFNSFGMNSFIESFDKSVSDNLILGGTSSMLKDTIEGGKQFVDTTTGSISHSKEDSQKTFAYINQLRQENGVKAITWDEGIYELAKWRAEDMTKRGYFDHVDPDGKCVGSYAKNFGIRYEPNSMAENIFGYSSSTWFEQNEAIDSWMTSRGHRFNLLYPNHLMGAIACDSKNCVFIGQGGSGWVCNTGEAGLSFWDKAGKQPGEK